MVELYKAGSVDRPTLEKALARYEIVGDKPNPRLV
jgi:hypothetical protein